jgi:hypothetical protein
MLGKSQGIDTALIRGYKVDSPKPFNQWKICRMKQGTCSNGYLMSASRTLYNVSAQSGQYYVKKVLVERSPEA